MATHTHSVSLVLFVLSSALAAGANDEAALHAFKVAAISGRNGDPLASWNSSLSGYCSWEGVRCRGRGRHQRVVALSLPSYQLTGVLSPAIGNLTSLRTLNLSKNSFSGDIPASLGRLHHLHVLDLSRNSFSGEVPTNLTSCINLTILNLNFNQLHGCVSSEIGDKLAGLRFLGLAKNNLTGTIPASLGNLSSLIILQLGFNQLEGIIPPIFGVMRGIQFLDLAFNNLSGEPLLSLYNLTSLRELELQGNMLQGSIPADIGSRFPSMQVIGFFSNQFTGPIPASFFNLTALQLIDLSENRFSGRVQRTVGRLHALRHLELSRNTLEADDREGWEFITSLSNCSQLEHLGLYRNAAFTGQLPSTISNLSTNLQFLRFDATGISGRIPTEYGEGSSISTIGDVYSLGILLLEMFTGLNPTNDMFRGSMDLHKFSADALSNRIWEIADTSMWLHTDTRDSTTRSRMEKCLVSVISLGISCSDKQPKERKSIQDAAVEMHAIRDSYIKFARSPVVDYGDIETAMSCVTG
ncbi:hypothetical protein PR202_gb26422 [Eleusine coracana subsp. coracana]|uniref:Leucine-rich repeat-containing N-terminal plant-type domain-containing protein n=1 Tax=Eleusine coracana subsp. coracana TaxID=191504 RepID=A0AAV5FP51_ELECO|nr:hypothetical protein PR202_gb26422 [Eleusine coracana subsp. coracana]